MPLFAGDLDAPTHGVDQPMTDREAEARALAGGLGGEERLEDLGQVRLGDAHARIRDHDLDLALGLRELDLHRDLVVIG